MDSALFRNQKIKWDLKKNSAEDFLIQPIDLRKKELSYT
jgi:hypothetical protein